MTIPVEYGQVTLHLQNTGAVSTADLVFGIWNSLNDDVVTVAANVQTALNAWTSFSANVSNTWACTTALVKLGPDDTGPATEVPITLGGSNTSPPASSNVAFLLKKITGTGGRRGRGRMFIPGVPEGAIDGSGALATGWQAALTAAGTQLLTQLAANDVPMVILHSQPKPPKPPIVLPPPDLVLSMPADAKAATQRRRMRR